MVPIQIRSMCKCLARNQGHTKCTVLGLQTLGHVNGPNSNTYMYNKAQGSPAEKCLACICIWFLICFKWTVLGPRTLGASANYIFFLICIGESTMLFSQRKWEHICNVFDKYLNGTIANQHNSFFFFFLPKTLHTQLRSCQDFIFIQSSDVSCNWTQQRYRKGCEWADEALPIPSMLLCRRLAEM